MQKKSHVKEAGSSRNLDDAVLSNLVELQKVHTSLAEKFDKLSSQIASLLSLFEMSARAFARQIPMQSMERDREFLDKIDKLLEQNKVIAKGLTLMEEKMREKLYGLGQNSPQGQMPMQPPQGQMQPSGLQPRPLPRF